MEDNIKEALQEADAGVNISFYSQINHLGKVSNFWNYGEEFPQTCIRASLYFELKTVSGRGKRLPYCPNASLPRKVFPVKEILPCREKFLNRSSLSEKVFPVRKSLPCHGNLSLSGEVLPVRKKDFLPNKWFPIWKTQPFHGNFPPKNLSCQRKTSLENSSIFLACETQLVIYSVWFEWKTYFDIEYRRKFLQFTRHI